MSMFDAFVITFIGGGIVGAMLMQTIHEHREAKRQLREKTDTELDQLRRMTGFRP